MLKLSLVIAVGYLALLAEVSAECNVCSSVSSAACINSTAFEVCFNNGGNYTSSGIKGSCNIGQVCTTEAGVCKTPSENVTSDCPAAAGCNSCLNGFACVSQTEFALCNGDKPTMTHLTCTSKKVCNINSAELCASPCDTDPTCSNAVAKKPDPAVDYADTCEGKTLGYYPNMYDATCKAYVLCEVFNTEMKAIPYSCGANEYFDATKSKCVTTVPAGCQV